MKKFSLLLLICVTIAFGQAPQLRLPESVAPLTYKAQLTLDPAKQDFQGKIQIELEVKTPSKTIWLNASKLHVLSAGIKLAGHTIKATVVDGGEDFVGFQFESELKPGKGQLDVEYSGSVRQKDSSGIFRMVDNGNQYLYTQFESTDARDAFPCFDEPSFKVPWQLTLTVPASNTAVSNTAITKQTVQDNRTTYVFGTTKPLPSYLVAFAIGPFDYVDGGKAGKKHIPVRIVTPKGHADEAKYAAEVTATIITRLEDYFQVPFPYDKSDQLAIPVTFGFGAMENAGLVTYAQNIILAKSSVDTVNRQREYAQVAAHELAHQWFGDLVTTAWWNDIWLNEAFATWMEQKLVREWKPEWNTNVNDVNDKLYAEREDSLVTARRIRQQIVTKDDISNAFDGITYQKGAAVISMFENWVTADTFRKGVTSYLKHYAYKNASAPEFLDSISSAGGKNVNQAFSTFLNQPGIPLLSVELDCKQASPTLHVEQRRFIPLGSKAPDETWQVPMCIRDSNGTTCELITQVKQDWKLKGSTCPDWIEANAKALGYYEVDYQGGLLANLTKGDVKGRLDAAERVDLLGDASALSKSGDMSTGSALELVPAFAGDTERHVASSALELALMPRSHQVSDTLMPQYVSFLQKNFDARAREIGWTPHAGEPDDISLLRPNLLRAMATWGHDQQLANEAKTLADKWLADHSSVNPNLVEPVLQTAAYYGDKAFFNRLVDTLSVTKDQQERDWVRGAMTWTRDSDAINVGFDALLTGKIPFIEAPGLLFAGEGSEATRKMAFLFLKSHYDEVMAKRPTGGGFDLASTLPYVGATFCDEQSKAELKDFFDPRVEKLLGARHTLDQVLETIDGCIAQKAKQSPSVAAFLQK